jgi:hypothetical protein
MYAWLALGTILAVVGVIASLAGSAVNLGPALVGAACFCGIVARIIQAAALARRNDQKPLVEYKD